MNPAGRRGGGRASHAVFRSLSVVLPAWNEAESVAAVVAAALRELDRRAIAGEVLVVDDGSEDGTAARATTADPRVRVLRHPRNRGYGAALRTGFAAARFEHIFFTDADHQFDLAELARLERWVGGHDVVAGFRSPRRDGWLRRLNGWGWSRVVDAALGVGVRDVDCAFKVLHRRVVERVDLASAGAFVNGELLARARAAGFRVKEVPVSHRPRRAGRPSGADPRVVGRAWVDLGRLVAEVHRERAGGITGAGPPPRRAPDPR